MRVLAFLSFIDFVSAVLFMFKSEFQSLLVYKSKYAIF